MKLGCNTVRRRLALLNADAPLDAGLSEHVAVCEGCRHVFRSNQALWSLLGEYDAPSLTVDIFPRVEQQLEQHRRRPLGERVAAWTEALIPRPRFAGAALAALGIIIGAWTGTMLTTTEDAQTSAPPVAVESETYAAIFDPSPPGFLAATDPWDVQGGEVP